MGHNVMMDIIMSPNFPSNYGNNNEVVWHITVSSSYAVMMPISYILTDYNDVLSFYDGSNITNYRVFFFMYPTFFLNNS